MRQKHYRSAGGVVVHDGKVLLLERPSRGEIRLPKGHIEEGETPIETALREVREESGCAGLVVIADLGMQQVSFVDPHQQRQVIRDEHYYLMYLGDRREVTAGKPDEQFIPRWVATADAELRLTFEAEREVVRRALRWIEVNERSAGDERTGQP
jgi:8-oxo-dGTP pyrophosphatase MutT (NUDIX family)